jgi:small subunit ribosomal protein S3
MGQKVNPRGFRIGISENHSSTWFANPRNYKELLETDYFLRQQTLKEFQKTPQLKDIPIAKIEVDCISLPLTSVNHYKKKELSYIQLKIYTPDLSLIYAQDKSFLKKLCSSLRKKVKTLIHIKFLKSSDAAMLNAKLIAESIGAKLETRENFRRAMKTAVRQTRRLGVKGIKIKIGGRLNGAEIARSEWVREGCVPLHTLRANIDYSTYRAQTIYGILGIKVWLFKGFLGKQRKAKA